MPETLSSGRIVALCTNHTITTGPTPRYELSLWIVQSRVVGRVSGKKNKKKMFFFCCFQFSKFSSFHPVPSFFDLDDSPLLPLCFFFFFFFFFSLSLSTGLECNVSRTKPAAFSVKRTNTRRRGWTSWLARCRWGCHTPPSTAPAPTAAATTTRFSHPHHHRR